MSTPPLIVRCGAFGDMVLLTPLIRLLAARFECPIDLLSAAAWTTPLLAGMPEIGRIELLSSRRMPYFACPSQWRVVRWLRQRGRGPVYLCDAGSRIRQLLSRAGVPGEDIVDGLAHSPVASGVIRTWPDLWLDVGMRDSPLYKPANSGIDPSLMRYPKLVVDEDQRAAYATWLRRHGIEGPVIAFQPGNKRTHKRGKFATRQHSKYWPPERWAAVANAVLQQHPAGRVTLCGSPLEFGVLEEIRRCCRDDRVMNLSRELPVPRLIALLEQAHSMVSVDTGPAHAAAALGCPLIVLFGAAPAQLWHPIGPAPVRILGGEGADSSRVDQIPAEDVIKQWSDLNLSIGLRREWTMPVLSGR